MKSILLLILTCLPLAVLTTASFVELARQSDQPVGVAAPSQRDEQAAMAAADAKRLAADRTVLGELRQTDLLAKNLEEEKGTVPIGAKHPAGRSGQWGQPPFLLPDVPPESSLQSLGKDWRIWVRTREMAAGILAAENLVQAADARQLEEAARKFTELQDRYKQLPPPGTETLLKLLADRCEELNRAVGRGQTQQQTADLAQKAKTAFGEQKYKDCVELCDQLLAKGSPAADETLLAEIRTLKLRAAFHRGAQRVREKLEMAATPGERLTLLQDFVAAHPNREAWTDAERRAVAQFETELQTLRQAGEAVKLAAAAVVEVEKLRRKPPVGFTARVEAAAAILERYPAREVQQSLRTLVVEWLAEAIPTKRIQEDPALREMETKAGVMVRGYFNEARDAGGTLVGYKRYPTAAEARNPLYEVGTARLDTLASPPGESVPRQSVFRYQEARRRLLANPGQSEVWSDLAKLCGALDATLAEYRKKPGSSPEELSFAREERGLRQLMASPLWAKLQKLLAR